MSITPLDLQTLFLRLGEVGKEQNNLKESVASQQAAGARRIKEDEIQQDHSVNKTEEDKDDQKIDDDKEKEQGKSDLQKRQGKSHKKQKIFKDPEIGSHIDISG